MLVIVGLTSGYSNSHGWYFMLGINTFKYPTFDFGVFSRYEFDEEGHAIQVVTIGLVLVVFEFEFYLGEIDN
jgi:hypothetical protein